MASTFFYQPYTPYKVVQMSAYECGDGDNDSGCEPSDDGDGPSDDEPSDDGDEPCLNGTCERRACEACAFLAANRVPARHERRMIARRARGIMPAARYPTLYLRSLLRPTLHKGLTPGQLLEALIRLSPMGRLQTYNWHYHTDEFFKGSALKARAAIGVLRAQVRRLCAAPLSPD